MKEAVPIPPTVREKHRLEDQLLDYAVKIVRIVEQLPDSLVGKHIAGELIAAGTLPLTYREQLSAAESWADHVQKFRNSVAGLADSRRWLRLIERLRVLGNTQDVGPLIAESEQLVKLLSVSVRVGQRRRSSGEVVGPSTRGVIR